jgi:DNA-binding transcriptional MerR regulator
MTTDVAKRHSRSDKSESGQYFPIRTVSNLTGVNSVTLRAWERRYGLITPHRTPKGHRLYTQSDIDLINQIVQLLERGISIGQVKSHLAQRPGKTETEKSAPKDFWQQSQQRMVNAIVRFNQDALDAVYNDAQALYPVDVVTRRLIIPLLRTLGERWQSAEGSVAEEHFFGSYLRNKLGARFHHQSSRVQGPKLLAACFPGEFHEVGLLLFCLSALDRDYQVVLLGANMPMDELALVTERAACEAIVLSGTAQLDPAVLEQPLKNLVSEVDMPVFVGGACAVRYHDLITRAGAVPVGDDVSQALRHIDDRLLA